MALENSLRQQPNLKMSSSGTFRVKASGARVKSRLKLDGQREDRQLDEQEHAFLCLPEQNRCNEFYFIPTTSIN